MGLDWVIRPRPTEEEQHDYDSVFRAKELVRTDVSDTVTRHAYSDMVPWQVQEYATTLENILETHNYDDETVDVVERAIAWLRYWADEKKSVYAWY